MRKNLFNIFRKRFKKNSELEIFLKGNINSHFFRSSDSSFSLQEFTIMRKKLEKQPILAFKHPKIRPFILTYLLNSFLQQEALKNDETDFRKLILKIRKNTTAKGKF